MLKSCRRRRVGDARRSFSTLQRVEIAEIIRQEIGKKCLHFVSVLFNESKLLKFGCAPPLLKPVDRFSTLQRVEIAEIRLRHARRRSGRRFSTLQRVEIAEIHTFPDLDALSACFSTLQRVEIAEISATSAVRRFFDQSFSTLQRVEIAEIALADALWELFYQFQYSSTSRNC